MSDSMIIREFLVALGYKIEDTQKFEAAIGRATKIVEQLGVATEAVAIAVTAAVTKISDRFEGLYYASQRVRSTVANIRAFDYAVSQLGGTADGARASLEGFGDFLRMNPGGEGLLRGLGIQTRDAQGHFRQTTDVLAEFGRRAKEMPYFQARAYASMMGIDPRTLDALMRGTAEYQKHYLDMIRESGVDQDKAAEASARWAQRWRDMIAQVSLFTDKLALLLQGPMARVIDWFKGADRTTHGLSTTLIALAALAAPLLLVLDPVVVAVLALAGGLAALAADYQNFRSGAGSGIDWGPWAKQIEQIADDLKTLEPLLEGLGKTVGGYLSQVLTAFAQGELRVFNDGLRTAIALLQALRDAKHGDWGAVAHDLVQAGRAAGSTAWDQTGRLLGTTGGAAAAAVAGAPAVNGKGLAAAGQVIDFFKGKGWTAQQAAGIAANLFTESRFNPNAKGDHGHAYGIAQWHEDRQAIFKQVMGKDIRQSSLMEQLAFVQYELTHGVFAKAGRELRDATTAYQAGARVSAYYERPKDRFGEIVRRGFLAGRLFDQANLGTHVVIHQKTDIHVHGSDAKSTAQAVAGAQDRVNGNMVRWTRASAS